MVGRERVRDAEGPRHVAHALLAVSEQLDDSEPLLICQRFEDRGVHSVILVKPVFDCQTLV